jgi:hypothetical protein
MPRYALPLAVSALLAATPLAAGETLNVAAPPGFELAREAVDPFSDRRVAEHVRAGETIWDWTAKVAVHVVPRARAPAGYTASVAGSFLGGCAGGSVETLFEGTREGRDAAIILATCPADPQDGAPSAFLMQALDGAEVTFVAEWAWRGALPGTAEVEAARRWLEGATVCGGATADCPSG